MCNAHHYPDDVCSVTYLPCRQGVPRRCYYCYYYYLTTLLPYYHHLILALACIAFVPPEIEVYVSDMTQPMAST